MTYDLVFDVSQAGYRSWYFTLWGIPFILFGIAAIKSSRTSPPDKPSWFEQIFPYFFTVFSVFWTLAVGFGNYYAYKHLSNALQNGECSVAEGKITKYETATRCGARGGTEELCINDVCFCLRHPGFDLSSDYASPVRVGKNTKVHHCNHKIARLEISK